MRGSIVWHCGVCKKNTKTACCQHEGAKYYVVYRAGRRQRWEPVGRQKKDAERRLTEILSALQMGTYREIKVIGFEDFADKWVRDYAEGRLKPLTLRRYRSLIKCYLNPAFNGFVLTQLSAENIEGFLSQWKHRKDRKPRTINQALAVLKIMMKYAKKWGYVRENPTEDVRPLQVEQKERDFLRPHEIRPLLEQLDDPYRTLILTGILTGMRVGELLGLQWGDVDFVNHVIHVRRTIYWLSKKELGGEVADDARLWRFGSPKSKQSVRAIVMTPRLKEAFELHRMSCPESPHDLVFCTRKGTPINPANLLRREFLPALAGAGLRRIRLHDLRHTFAALLINQGVNPKFIQSQLGHASIQMTMDTYGHLFPGAYLDVGEQLDANVFGPQSNSSLTKQAKTSRNTVIQEHDEMNVTQTQDNQ